MHEAFAELWHRIVTAALVVRHGAELAEHEHDAHVRGIEHAVMMTPLGPTEVTLVLYVCDDCGGVHVEQVPGRWAMQQLTTRVPVAEVVARNLNHSGPQGQEEER